jgi:hypothetical protein
MSEPDTPTEAVRQGKCPMCLGRGVVYAIRTKRTEPCLACAGSGDLAELEKRLVADFDQV